VARRARGRVPAGVVLAGAAVVSGTAAAACPLDGIIGGSSGRGRRDGRRGGYRGRVSGMRVLVIEDHEDLAGVLARGLRRDGMAVDVALDGGEGWFKLGVSDYDVVVLDRDLPVLHGDERCRWLRAQGAATRVLMLTAAGGPRRAAEGLGLGADDYLAKPFDFVELIARVRALARRPAAVRPPVLEASGIRLDPATRSASRSGRPLELARKEFGVLEVLLAAGGRVVSAEELLEKVWDENADLFTTAVRTTVKKLRRKLGEPDPIQTLIGSGYRIVR
jgi:DNA-binding response OmpR family regulator